MEAFAPQQQQQRPSTHPRESVAASTYARLPVEIVVELWRWWVVGGATVAQHVRIIWQTYVPKLGRHHGWALAEACRSLVNDGTLPCAPRLLCCVSHSPRRSITRADGWLTDRSLLGARLLAGEGRRGPSSVIVDADSRRALSEADLDIDEMGNVVDEEIERLKGLPDLLPHLGSIVWCAPFAAIEFTVIDSGIAPISVRIATFAPNGKDAFTLEDFLRVFLRFYNDSPSPGEFAYLCEHLERASAFYHSTEEVGEERAETLCSVPAEVEKRAVTRGEAKRQLRRVCDWMPTRRRSARRSPSLRWDFEFMRDVPKYIEHPAFADDGYPYIVANLRERHRSMGFRMSLATDADEPAPCGSTSARLLDGLWSLGTFSGEAIGGIFSGDPLGAIYPRANRCVIQ
jgi:hypothetical protein